MPMSVGRDYRLAITGSWNNDETPPKLHPSVVLKYWPKSQFKATFPVKSLSPFNVVTLTFVRGLGSKETLYRRGRRGWGD